MPKATAESGVVDRIIDSGLEDDSRAVTGPRPHPSCAVPHPDRFLPEE